MRTRLLLVGVLAGLVVLAGCKPTLSPATQSSTPTPTPPIPTATPTPKPTPTPIPTATPADYNAACPGARNQWSFTPVYRLGDVLVRTGYVGIPSRKLADSTPQQPLLIPDPNSQGAVDAQIPVEPRVNPTDGGGFGFELCNASKTQAHEVGSIRLRVTQATPYTGHLQTWNTCDGYYSRSEPEGAAGYGCGFGFNADEHMKATFPSQLAVGTEATISYSVPSGDAVPTDSRRTKPYGPLPETIPPGQSMVGFINTTPPSTAGTYAFAFALTVDRSAQPYIPAGTPAIFAASPQKWTGQACLTAAMQKLIPQATTPPSYYICPKQ